jgi:hypothetical protein
MGHLSNHIGRVPRGKALLIDHLPIQFLQSSQGVRTPRAALLLLTFLKTLLIIYNNGDACFYPVNDQAKQPNSSNVIKILGKESNQPAARPKLSGMSHFLNYGPLALNCLVSAADPKNSAAASKYFAYDIAHQEQEIYTAHRVRTLLIVGVCEASAGRPAACRGPVNPRQLLCGGGVFFALIPACSFLFARKIMASELFHLASWSSHMTSDCY